jgi:RND superfamily putative drug exporter
VRARSNLAESAAGWSARNRRWAVLGWLAFVVPASVAGALVGQRNLTNAQMGNGESVAPAPPLAA